MNEIFILIPIHNRINLTLKCLESLKAQTYDNYNIVIIDDGSTDNSSGIIAKSFPDITILKGNGQLFWGGAVHKAISFVLDQLNPKSNDFVLLLNNDTVVDRDYLSSLFSASEAKGNSIIGSVSVDKESKTITDGGVRINWKTAKYTRYGRNKRYDKYINNRTRFTSANVLSGRGMFIPLKILKKIGNVNHKKLPHYGADYEFSVRALRSGYNLFVDNQAVVFVHTEETGLNTHFRKLSFIEFLKGFFTKKSYNSLKYRWNFAKLTVPNNVLIFYIFDIVRSFLGGVYHQIKFRLNES